jgi:hypothetical protein
LNGFQKHGADLSKVIDCWIAIAMRPGHRAAKGGHELPIGGHANQPHAEEHYRQKRVGEVVRCMTNSGRRECRPAFLAIQSLMRSSFEHALEGMLQDSPMMPRSGTNSHGPTDHGNEDVQPA